MGFMVKSSELLSENLFILEAAAATVSSFLVACEKSSTVVVPPIAADSVPFFIVPALE